MEANMSGMKRRLNKVIVDYKSQASFTARRLVGQIRTIDRRARHSALGRMVVVPGRQRRAAASSAGSIGQPGPTGLSGGPARVQQKRQFEYTFSPAEANYDEPTSGQIGQWTSIVEFAAPDQSQSQNQDHGRLLAAGDSPVKIKTNLQKFVRYSALNNSNTNFKRRSSARRRRSNRSPAIRQVRFQPVPVAIDISATSAGKGAIDREEDEEYGWGSDFDEQSVVSDESSRCSSDLTNNNNGGSSSGSEHSGSQDSGHSTQHSAYSNHSCVNHEHEQQLPSIDSNGRSIESKSPSIESDSPSIARSSGSPSPVCGQNDKVQCLAISKPIESSPKQQEADKLVKPLDDEVEERRNRFLQNRLIINDKLESIFRSRSSSTCKPEPEEAPKVSKSADNSPVKQPLTRQETSKAQKVTSEQIDRETRLRLLEQQRQMSLKLKQKPRRKTARRAFETEMCIESKEDGSYPSENPTSQPQLRSHFTRTGSQRPRDRDSLIKQLSMVCLRQSGQLTAAAIQPTNLGTSSQLVGICSNKAASQTQPKPAMSLGQLVKDVIDDYERPNRLSTQTMNILNRSNDSFSSDSNEERKSQHSLTTTSYANRDSLKDHEIRSAASTSSSTSSLDSLPANTADKYDSYFGQQVMVPTSATQIEPTTKGCLPTAAMLAHPSYVDNQQAAQGTYTYNLVDQSFSSIGTIDGLEYRKTFSLVGQFKKFYRRLT